MMKVKTQLLTLLALTIICGVSGCKESRKDEGAKLTVTAGFTGAPANLFASSAYGENLYNGEIGKGYLFEIDEENFLQFPLNFGYNYDADFILTYCYTFFNGGFALSDFHDMEEASYMNQLSVYDTTSPSGGKFTVATGYSMTTDPLDAKYSDYNGCAHAYLTDRNGYMVQTEGSDQPKVTGESREGYFNSVYINNTTYTYLTMRDGDTYASALNMENEGWFKVQFIAFNNDNEDGKPLAYTEIYLANFKKGQADDFYGIIDEWVKVDLSVLPKCAILVVNFVGSDSNEWGLNTPAYCALDNFEVTIETKGNNYE